MKVSRRGFIKVVGTAAAAAAFNAPLVVEAHEPKPEKLAPRKVRGGQRGTAQLLVRYEGEFLEYCMEADTEAGTARVLCTDSNGDMVAMHGEFVIKELQGEVELWSKRVGQMYPVSEPFVLPCPDGRFFYTILRPFAGWENVFSRVA